MINIKRFFLYFFLSVFTQSFYGQIDFNFHHNIDAPIPCYSFNNDSTSHSFQILQIPFLGLDFHKYSNPSLDHFLSTSNNQIILNLNDYKTSFQNSSHHLLDFKNTLFYYAQKKDYSINSFGFTHRFFGELSLSNELMDLIVDGNYSNLNSTIDLDNNYARLYNYFSIFYGYANRINNQSLFAFKLKLLKGGISFGFDNREFSLLVSDNFGTEQNPFSSRFITDLSYFVNSDYSILSNLGLAVDIELQHQLSDYLNVYTQINELGFISWREDQYTSKGSFDFNGIDYSLDEDLMTEFSNIYDTIVDIFDIRENNNIKSVSLLPLEFDFGLNFESNLYSEFYINYNLKKLFTSFLHTGSLSYLHYFDGSELSIMSSYSFNKFNYSNLTFHINKKWNYFLHTNMYVKNIIGFFNNSYSGITQGGGIGFEMLLSF